MIRFNHDNFLTLSEGDLQQWLIGIALCEGYAVEEVEYNFVDAETQFSLNKKYLNHERTTPILLHLIIQKARPLRLRPTYLLMH